LNTKNFSKKKFRTHDSVKKSTYRA